MVEKGNKIKVVAEIGINHSGRMDIAKELVSRAKEAGADYVKFQIRTVETVYAGELDNPRNDGNPYGWKTVGDQKRGIEFSLDQYHQIDAHCKRIGIPWFASCWDVESLWAAARHFEWPYHKIASAMVTNLDYMREVADLRHPLIMSTGGCTPDEIQAAVETIAIVQKITTPELIIMHCVAQYPCPDNQLNLKMIHTLRQAYPYATIGYSGHEVGLYPSIMAIAMGAQLVERHFTLDRSMYGSDQAASLEFKGLKTLCEVAHEADSIIGDGNKSVLPGEAACMSKLRYWE